MPSRPTGDWPTRPSSFASRTPTPPLPPTISIQTIFEGQELTGLVRWEAAVTGKVARVDFLLDGVLVDSEFGAPWGFDWYTTQETRRRHVLAVRAFRPDGKIAASQPIHVPVAPPAPAPAP